MISSAWHLIAQAAGPVTPSAASYQDYIATVLVTALIGAVGAFWKWAIPKLDAAFSCVPKLEKLCEQNTHSLEDLSTATKSLAQNFGMLSRLVSAQSVACLLQAKRVLLVVEDSVLHSRILIGILGPVAVRQKLILVPVMTMEEALAQIPQACLMILDVNLPDADMNTCRALIEVCPCPVIIHSGNDYTKSDFPGARAIIKKGSDADELIRLIDDLISAQR